MPTGLRDRFFKTNTQRKSTWCISIVAPHIGKIVTSSETICTSADLISRSVWPEPKKTPALPKTLPQKIRSNPMESMNLTTGEFRMATCPLLGTMATTLPLCRLLAAHYCETGTWGAGNNPVIVRPWRVPRGTARLGLPTSVPS